MPNKQTSALTGNWYGFVTKHKCTKSEKKSLKIVLATMRANATIERLH